MEAYQRYPNTIQQAIAHTYMGWVFVPYAYGMSNIRIGQYTHTGQSISTNQFIINTWSFGVGEFWNNSLIVKACM